MADMSHGTGLGSINIRSGRVPLDIGAHEHEHTFRGMIGSSITWACRAKTREMEQASALPPGRPSCSGGLRLRPLQPGGRPDGAHRLPNPARLWTCGGITWRRHSTVMAATIGSCVAIRWPKLRSKTWTTMRGPTHMTRLHSRPGGRNP